MDNQNPGITHTIRLTSAWEPPVARDGAWVRRFGRPSGIEPGDRVLLVVETPAIASLTLNTTPLPAPAARSPQWAHDITSLLETRNELVLVPDRACAETAADVPDVNGRASLPARYGNVTLQILTLPAAGR